MAIERHINKIHYVAEDDTIFEYRSAAWDYEKKLEDKRKKLQTSLLTKYVWQGMASDLCYLNYSDIDWCSWVYIRDSQDLEVLSTLYPKLDIVEESFPKLEIDKWFLIIVYKERNQWKVNTPDVSLLRNLINSRINSGLYYLNDLLGFQKTNICRNGKLVKTSRYGKHQKYYLKK